jgi:pSer/pThr/pTyr-binding forkhead associated (FHA) protein
MPKSFSLILTAPGADAVQFRLTDDRVSLGRDDRNQIALDVNAVSSRHCEFLRADATGGYRLVDLGSTNGTRVNGQRIMSAEGVPLKNGDRILLAETIEGHFIEAIEAEPAKRSQIPARHRVNGGGGPPQAPVNGAVTQSLRQAGPVPVWVDASAATVTEEEMNPVAAAVARQEAALGNQKIGKRPN